MANQEHLETLLEAGVKAWNAWRLAHKGIIPDLREANLSGAFLNRVDFSRADLSGASLIETDLGGANLRGANLSKANLSGAFLIEADLKAANLRGADLSGADLTGASLRVADLNMANLRNADLNRVALIETDLSNADLTACRIYGISVWNIKLSNTAQTNLVITRSDEPTITVDNLELAQFIYLLLKYEKLRDVLNTVTQRGVLLLGRFVDGGLDLLQTIAEKLREMDYIPIIFDFDRPASRDFTETVKTLVGLSRFVIAEMSGPSVPHELNASVPHFKIPFVPIRRKGSQPYAMFNDLLAYPWVLSPVEFRNTQNLLELIPSEIIKPAEDKAKARQDQLSQLFDR